MNPNGDDPNEEQVLKPICFVFDFAPTRALRQLSEYGIGLSPERAQPRERRRGPGLVPAGAGLRRRPHDADRRRRHPRHRDGGHLGDAARAEVESAVLVNVDNDTLRKILDNPEAMAALARIEGWRALGDNVLETIINKSERVQEIKDRAKDHDLSAREKRELTEEKEYKSKRKLVQEKLIKFATRIPAFMYLTDFRENTLPGRDHEARAGALSSSVTGLHGRRLPPARRTARLQHRADEPGGVRLPPLRGRHAVLHRHRLAPRPHAHRPV